MHFLELVLWFVFAAWVAAGLFAFWNFIGITIVRPVTFSTPPSGLPRVSILLAARNEQEMLPATLDSLLEFDYPDFEIILVDDDSDDRTGAIADEWSQRGVARGKLRVIHNHHLPPGWRGKVHAMSMAAQSATGEWVLSTDADVVFHPSLLRQAVQLALRKKVQFLSLTPEVTMQSWAERVVLPAFGFLLFMMFPIRLVNHPRSSRAMAAGAFMLMRRGDLVATGGYARLRDTLIEDLRMAELFKRSGRRTYLAVSQGTFHTRMYENWREVFEGLARSAWEGTGCSLWKVLAGVAVGNSLAVLPCVSLAVLWLMHLVAGAPLAHNPDFIAAVAASAASAIVYCPVVVFAGLSPLYTFTLPLASLFYSTISLVSAFRSLTGPGLRWKGRSYQPPAA
ncbi:MAG TPA: glycosyltransferase family 2 protein [Terriglobia bacterium]|nr:glycosyltransferase family 2 protein [Terriglobia bacterium]